MSAFKIIISIATFLAVFGQIESLETLNVSVYYESLCPDSKKFITTQLYPVYKNTLGEDVLNIEFVPFGNAEAKKDEAGEWTFTCQHGDDECYGNKIQSCALYIFTKSEGIDFVNCAMASDDASNDTNLEICSKSSGVSWLTLQTCLETGFADELLAANGDVTAALDPPLRFVPTVFFDGKFDQDLQDGAQTDFLQTACALYEEKPDGCAQ